MDLQTARAGPRGDAVTGSRNSAILGSLHIPSTADPDPIKGRPLPLAHRLKQWQKRMSSSLMRFFTP